MKPANTFRLIAFGDVIGDPGIRALFNVLPDLRKRFMPDAIVVNGENSAQGFGIYRKNAEDMFGRGVDVITGGNHIWQRKETFEFIDAYPALLRPINYPPATPGHGSVVLEKNGIKFAVVNAIGRIFMDPMECPFRTLEKELETLRSRNAKLIYVDFHAEATSEKELFGRYFDGKVSAIWGTHTHVMTADEIVLPARPPTFPTSGSAVASSRYSV
jgi:metallophosphoesterase (TIGR00282 family)